MDEWSLLCFVVFKRDLFLFCVCVLGLHICTCTVCAWSACVGQKRVSNPPELELQVVVVATWVLGIKPES